ncbi:MAG: 50S ribosomal protein L32 [Patescibacteria group bacterium]
MANPKKRTSKSRKGNRRSHHALTAAATTVCKKCGAMKRPHFACAKCEK